MRNDANNLIVDGAGNAPAPFVDSCATAIATYAGADVIILRLYDSSEDHTVQPGYQMRMSAQGARSLVAHLQSALEEFDSDGLPRR
mmetsp:Transcript_3345/g.5777  ORF Transcript_3345/g.5777 Transcript_3345/m.5777 type:complete len:86 (+) Transcript_3345:993-1250(+)